MCFMYKVSHDIGRSDWLLRKQREDYIKAKYIDHQYTIKSGSDVRELQCDFQQAIQQKDMQAILQVHAEGLDLMTVLPESPSEETALHLAIAQEDGSSLPIVDFIIQNSSLNSLGRQTRDGNTCLHLCAMLNKAECMKCLLRTKPEIAHIKNSGGQTALDIANENSFQLCADLCKAALEGEKDVFEHMNIEWDLMTDEGPEFSDDDLDLKKPGFRRCKAIFDCDADNTDELNFKAGEIIVLLREEEQEWWEGEIENQPDRRGLFPISFVEGLPD